MAPNCLLKLYATLNTFSIEELLADKEIITKRCQEIESSLVIKEAEKNTLCPRLSVVGTASS